MMNDETLYTNSELISIQLNAINSSLNEMNNNLQDIALQLRRANDLKEIDNNWVSRMNYLFYTRKYPANYELNEMKGKQKYE